MKTEKNEELINWREKLEQFRNKFSNKQIHIMTAILEVLWIIIMVLALRKLLAVEIITIVLLGGVFIAMIMYIFLFDLDGRAVKKKRQEIASSVPKKFHLKPNEFVEVLLSPHNGIMKSQEIREAIVDLRELGVKYYAKINPENTQIILIKKKKDGQKVGKTKIIEDFVYFNYNYRPKEK